MGIKAKYLRTLEGYRGEARLYELSESVPYGYHADDSSPTTRFVVVSAANTRDHGPETYIFPSDGVDDIIYFGEMHGSFIGRMDHNEAIRNAGWELVDE